MHQWLLALVAPALIASVITLLINLRAEKVRAQRDYIGSTFEAVRTSINNAVAAAADYYPLDGSARTPLLEAKLWMADRELRFAMPTLLDNASSRTQSDLDGLTSAFDDFVAALTGANFQQHDAPSDLKHFRKIASIGAELRGKLMDARHKELKLYLDKDPLSRIMFYLNEPLGIR